MSSSSSSSFCSELPYFCPRCGDEFRFSSVPELRAHLVSRHTYETLLVLSQARVRSSRPGALLPLASPAVSQKQSSSLAMEAHSLPLPLACLDLASSSASVQLLRGMFSPSDCTLPASTGHQDDPSTALALHCSLEPFPGRKLGDLGVQLGLEFGLSVGVGLEERLGLGLDCKIARTFAEVGERVNRHMGQLRAELQRREAELEQERRDGEQLRSKKQEAEERATYLFRQVSAAMEMMERLKTDLEGKEKKLVERQQEMVDIERFLRETAEKEAAAKSRLQVFIETLLERADRAERQLLQLSSHTHHSHYTRHSDKHTHPEVYADPYTPVRGRGGCSLDGSTDDIIANKMQETFRNRRSYSVSGSYRLGEQLYSHHHYRAQQGGWGSTWSKKGRCHYSTEEEEEDNEEEEEEGLLGSTEMRRLIFTRAHTPGSDILSSLHSSPSHCHGNRELGADTLRLRAGLFCIFPYLDVRSLLHAAEVCSDWRFVARHPAVWTCLRLENARVSSEFLTTLSQWCTQTQSVVLTNLKPRSRRADETREDYHRNTRQQSTRFGNRCLQTIGRCWPHLRSLSVGGAGCGTQGLAAVGVCNNIRSIIIDVSVADYFEEPDTQEAQHLFGEIINTLKVLQKRPRLCDILQVKADGFC
ncbi:hypothetical protein PAMP_016109 [Pampus punctatissimus]